MPKIEIYSTPTCHFCHMAKDYFTSLNLTFSDYDVQADPSKMDELAKRAGPVRGVPVIFIDEEMVIGFDKDKIDELLQAKKN